jgi:hypothetical protein
LGVPHLSVTKLKPKPKRLLTAPASVALFLTELASALKPPESAV